MTRSLKEDNRVIIFCSLTSRTRLFSVLSVSRKILDLSLSFNWMLLVNSSLFVSSSISMWLTPVNIFNQSNMGTRPQFFPSKNVVVLDKI